MLQIRNMMEMYAFVRFFTAINFTGREKSLKNVASSEQKNGNFLME